MPSPPGEKNKMSAASEAQRRSDQIMRDAITASVEDTHKGQGGTATPVRGKAALAPRYSDSSCHTGDLYPGWWKFVKRYPGRQASSSDVWPFAGAPWDSTRRGGRPPTASAGPSRALDAVSYWCRKFDGPSSEGMPGYKVQSCSFTFVGSSFVGSAQLVGGRQCTGDLYPGRWRSS